jgi:hypothetical protein
LIVFIFFGCTPKNFLDLDTTVFPLFSQLHSWDSNPRHPSCLIVRHCVWQLSHEPQLLGMSCSEMHIVRCKKSRVFWMTPLPKVPHLCANHHTLCCWHYTWNISRRIWMSAFWFLPCRAPWTPCNYARGTSS